MREEGWGLDFQVRESRAYTSGAGEEWWFRDSLKESLRSRLVTSLCPPTRGDSPYPVGAAHL